MGFWGGGGRQVQWAKLTFFVSILATVLWNQIIMAVSREKISRCLLFDLFVGECDLAYVYFCLWKQFLVKHLTNIMCVYLSFDARGIWPKGGIGRLFWKKHIPAMSPVTVASEVPTYAESVFIKMWQHGEYYFHECLPAALLVLAAACCCLPAAAYLLLLTCCCSPAACLLLACCLRAPCCCLLLLAAACLLLACCLPAACLLLACCLPAACCCFFLPAACCCLPAAVPWWFFFPDVTSHYLMWLFCIAAVPWGWCAFSRLMWLKYGARMCLT